jgi:hypothetical protein
MNIQLSELRQICDKLFDYCKEMQLFAFEIPVDYYWNIPKVRVYDPYTQPTEFDIGSLTDDWKELNELMISKREVFT